MNRSFTKQTLRISFILSTTVIFILSGCAGKEHVRLPDAEILHQNQDQLTQVIIYDVFTPPVASRLYVYSSLAAYEAIRYSQEGSVSIAEKLHGFESMPQPEKDKQYNFTLAASKAFFNVVRHVKVFSVDSLNSYEESLYGSFKEELDDSVYARSLYFGDKIAGAILARAMKDGYIQSRGKPKYLGSNDEGKWRPTPPDYLDGVEWCWTTMKPMVMDSSAQFKPGKPPRFSLDTSSFFYKSMREVYDINKNLTEEQMTIARFWDDNPFVIEHSGHMMFGNKKITPGGHWMGICAIASKQSGADAVKTARAYALTSLALYESFISCLDEKYRSSYIRPVTVINETIDPAWLPFLQTPPFPEYTSGHSTITACTATVLTYLFGDNFAFQDTSDLRYIGMQRHFNSFNEAAAEASISRVYGGIHYKFSVDTGAAQGKKLGDFINEKIRNQ
ncbi:MAG: vanadium-dependent haloperoxidase [Bacteroidales bacterium]|nr:vanadium-dependent haloperoxidase [Bacteroidales bacterium]